MRELILTSKSPRRRTILEEHGYRFRIFPIEVSEILDKNLNLYDQISHCAQTKVEAALHDPKLPKSNNFLFLAADTVVVFRGRVLGKPVDKKEAFSILTELSGETHEVVTGFCLYDVQTQCFILSHDRTHVKFHSLNPGQIEEYIKTGEPMDKAGAYGIQGRGREFVESYEGSYLNVVGLPLEKVEQHIKEKGWVVEKES